MYLKMFMKFQNVTQDFRIRPKIKIDFLNGTIHADTFYMNLEYFPVKEGKNNWFELYSTVYMDLMSRFDVTQGMNFLKDCQYVLIRLRA